MAAAANYRSNSLTNASVTFSSPMILSDHKATAYRAGAVVNGDVTANTIVAVWEGHKVEVADVVLIQSAETGLIDTTTILTVAAAAAAQLTFNELATVKDGDTLVTLGGDSLTGSVPTYDGSDVVIYPVPDAAATPVVNSELTTSQIGFYEYWTDATEVWELIRDQQNAPVAYLKRAVLVGA